MYSVDYCKKIWKSSREIYHFFRFVLFTINIMINILLIFKIFKKR